MCTFHFTYTRVHFVAGNNVLPFVYICWKESLMSREKEACMCRCTDCPLSPCKSELCSGRSIPDKDFAHANLG